jgi:hypothetical protein
MQSAFSSPMASQIAFTWKTDSVPLTSFATSTSG